MLAEALPHLFWAQKEQLDSRSVSFPPAREQEERWGSGDMDELGRKGHESSVMNAKTPPKVIETITTSRVISV